MVMKLDKCILIKYEYVKLIWMIHWNKNLIRGLWMLVNIRIDFKIADIETMEKSYAGTHHWT